VLVVHLPAGGLFVGLLPAALLFKASFALRELGAAAERVRRPVAAGDLPAAREALRALCSRDPSQLDAEALLAAAIQSLAENASDSFVAPLFYYLVARRSGAIAYRAVNTLDAMIGYRASTRRWARSRPGWTTWPTWSPPGSRRACCWWPAG